MKRKLNLFVSLNSNYYLFLPWCNKSFLECCTVDAFFWFQPQDRLLRLCYKLHILPRITIQKSAVRKRNKEYNRIIIHAALTNEQVRILAAENCRPILYLWDDNYAKDISYRLLFLKENLDIYAFSEESAKRTGTKLNPTFYVRPPIGRFDMLTLPTTDIFFCGGARDRRETLLQAMQDFQAQGLQTDFHVHKADPPLTHSGWINEPEWLSYDDTIRMMLRARAIFDCYAYGATGYTLRVMEHMFFSKKLITTNALVRQADFYNPANIFVYGEDDITTLKAWLD
ncbi:MAG: hypothetical protein LBR73_06245, partial [Oscillospiraceae bacterium]|nr:hypothetical protein [Oscillospiraceae bacterium]